MAYDTNSEHPWGNATVRTSGPAQAEDAAEVVEAVYRTTNTDLSAINLANTLEVIAYDQDGGRTVYAYDANETNTGGAIIEDSDGRKFVAVELWLTQTEFDALAYKPDKTTFNIIAG